MRSALVGKRTTATSFHRQNTGNVFANTLEYWSKYTNILNPTLREDRPVEVWQIVRSVLGLKKRQDEFVGALFVDKRHGHWPATFGDTAFIIVDYMK